MRAHDPAMEGIRQVRLSLGVLLGVLLMSTALRTPPALSQERDIVPFASDWRFLNPLGRLDDPEGVNPDFDSTWFLHDFDDTGWSAQTAPFQYGSVTVLDSRAPFPLLDPGEGDRYSAYFRLKFETHEALQNLMLELVADDGAVVYLDGEEVLRHNCCVDSFGQKSDADYFAFANQRGNEDAFTQRAILDGGALNPGSHLLAVSVHQGSTLSDDLGFEARLFSQTSVGVSLTRGIDTMVSQSGLNGPDAAYGAVGQNPDGVERWEWDQFDAGGQNHALLWFDVSPELLARFNDGRALLRLHVDNPGHAGAFHRMTSDWLDGPSGADNVTWNNLPGGPGIVPGQNARLESSLVTQDLFDSQGDVLEIDVSEDLRAWARGQPNYGWGILPTGGDGTAITSMESLINPTPELIIFPGDGGADLRAGDADQDLDFDQVDLVQVLSRGKYATGQPATWGDGDWNGAPGGSSGAPPPGDGVFNQIDIVAALTEALYLAGPYAGLAAQPQQRDNPAKLKYDATTGEISLDVPADTQLTSLDLHSDSGMFMPEKALHLDGAFDLQDSHHIFKATVGGSFGALSLGHIAARHLAPDLIATDLSVSATTIDGGIYRLQIVYVPEPITAIMVWIGIVWVLLPRRRLQAVFPSDSVAFRQFRDQSTHSSPRQHAAFRYRPHLTH